MTFFDDSIAKFLVSVLNSDNVLVALVIVFVLAGLSFAIVMWRIISGLINSFKGTLQTMMDNHEKQLNTIFTEHQTERALWESRYEKLWQECCKINESTRKELKYFMNSITKKFKGESEADVAHE